MHPSPGRGTLHHLEIWVPDLAAARPRWAWLLGRLGYQQHQSFEGGCSYRLGTTYVVLEQSPSMTGDQHERCRPGVNHLAFHAGSRGDVDDLTLASRDHGWSLLFGDRHPYAGGPDHYAAYLHDDDGYEVELVASEHRIADASDGDAVVLSATPPTDLAEVVALYRAVGWSGYADDPERLRSALAGSSRVVSARRAGRLVGLARVVSDGASIAYLQDVLVHPDARRTGVGRRLVEAALEPYADVRQKVLLTDDEPAQRAFYESLGYTEVRDHTDGRLRAFVRFDT